MIALQGSAIHSIWLSRTVLPQFLPFVPSFNLDDNNFRPSVEGIVPDYRTCGQPGLVATRLGGVVLQRSMPL